MRTVKPGDLVVGSFVISDTCPICTAGYQSRCVNGIFVDGGIGTRPNSLAFPMPTAPWSPRRGSLMIDLIPSLLAASDVLGTGWFAADAAEEGPVSRSPSSATALSD